MADFALIYTVRGSISNAQKRFFFSLTKTCFSLEKNNSNAIVWSWRSAVGAARYSFKSTKLSFNSFAKNENRNDYW